MTCLVQPCEESLSSASQATGQSLVMPKYQYFLFLPLGMRNFTMPVMGINQLKEAHGAATPRMELYA